MNTDGVSYIEIAEAYARGEWAAVVNAYWSPLYSWLLTPLFVGGGVPPQYEYLAVHSVNFVILLIAIACFEFFFRRLVGSFSPQDDLAGGVVQAWQWWALGYSLFAYAALVMVDPRLVTPDLLVLAWVCLAAGLLVQVHESAVLRPRLAVGFGAVLGGAYLTKAAMLPIGAVFLITAAVMLRRRGSTFIAGAALVFLVTAGWWVAVLSYDKGRLTFGESGKLVHAWFVDDLQFASHWQGGPPENGAPAHPTRQLSTAPAAYEFASPVPGTYPVWYDPTYWYEGARSAPTFRQQARAVYHGTAALLGLPLFTPVLVGVVAFLIGRRSVILRAVLTRTWYLFVPALAGLGAYALVLVEPRYVAPFVLIGTLALLLTLGTAASRDSGPSSAWPQSVALAVALVVFLIPARQVAMDVLDTLRSRLSGSSFVSWEIARQLPAHGIAPGASVAVIGDTFGASHWARLARVRIVAEIPREEIVAFWSAPEAVREETLAVFRQTDAEAVIATAIPPSVGTAGWMPIGDSGLYLRNIR